MGKNILIVLSVILISAGCTPKPKPATPAEKAVKIQKVVGKTDSASKAK